MNSNLLKTDYLEKLSELLLDNVSDAIISTDENFRIKTWNKAAEKIYGLSFYDVSDRNTKDVFHYEFLNDSLELSRKKLIEEGEWKGIVIFNRHDGKKVFLNASVSTLLDENNEAMGYVAVNRDITDVYQIKDLLQNEQRLNFALQGAGDGVWEYNFQTNGVYYSPAYKKMLGFSEHEFPDDSREWRGRIHPEDLVLVENIEEQYRQGEIENHSIEYRIKNKSGYYIWVLDRGMVIEKTEEGKPVKLIGTQTNIDYQKKSEEKIKSFLESAPDAMVITNEKGIIEIINTQAEKLFDYTRQEMIGKPIEYLIPERHVQNHKSHREIFSLEPETRQMGKGFELFARKKSGEEIPVEISLSPIHTDEGMMVCAAIRDITERKKAEQQLKESEEKFNKAFHSSPAGITLTNQVTDKWVDVNESFLKMTGYQKEEIIGHNSTELGIIDSAARVKILEEIRRVGSIKNKELIFNKKSGEKGAALFSIEQIILNRELYFIAILYDITERKKAEETLLKTKAELLDSIERYTYVSKATSDAIWDWDIATDTIYRGEGFKTIFGYKESVSTLEIRMSSIIHPDDGERVRTELENALAGQALHWHSEYRFKCADGRYKQVIDKAYIIRNENGKAIRMIGAVQDVTEQRRLQEQLVKEEERKKKEVLQAIIHAQERERHEISHELHDNISQILTTCKLLLEAAIHRDDKKYLQQTKENLQKAIDEMRDMSHRLNPATLKYIGLEGSINDLLNKINTTGSIRISFLCSLNEIDKISDDIQLALFRIIQEQLNNILRHANAKKVVIDLLKEKEKIKLTITDDGKGYDLQAKKHGLGLRNIFNRAEFHKGTAQIFTEPGKGFKLQVQIPL